LKLESITDLLALVQDAVVPSFNRKVLDAHFDLQLVAVFIGKYFELLNDI